MKTSRLRAVAALTFACIAASCGGDDGGSGPTFSDSVSTADAELYASDAIGNVGQAIGQLNFGGGSIPIGLGAPAFIRRMLAQRPQMGARIGGRNPFPAAELLDWRTLVARVGGPQGSAAEGCVVTESGFDLFGGAPVDVDQNGLPDDLYMKQDCLSTDSTSSADTTFTFHLLLELHVKQNFAALYGYDITGTIELRSGDSFGNFDATEIHGTEGLDIRSGSASHHYNYTLHGSTKQDDASTDDGFGVNWDVAFAPDGSIVFGDDLPDGALTLTGREYRTNSEGSNLSFSLETDTPLAYSSACWLADSNPPFTAGVLIGHLNNNASSASFSATFTDCGVDPAISTEGTHDPSVSAVVR